MPGEVIVLPGMTQPAGRKGRCRKLCAQGLEAGTDHKNRFWQSTGGDCYPGTDRYKPSLEKPAFGGNCEVWGVERQRAGCRARPRQKRGLIGPPGGVHWASAFSGGAWRRGGAVSKSINRTRGLDAAGTAPDKMREGIEGICRRAGIGVGIGPSSPAAGMGRNLTDLLHATPRRGGGDLSPGSLRRPKGSPRQDHGSEVRRESAGTPGKAGSRGPGLAGAGGSVLFLRYPRETATAAAVVLLWSENNYTRRNIIIWLCWPYRSRG